MGHISLNESFPGIISFIAQALSFHLRRAIARPHTRLDNLGGAIYRSPEKNYKTERFIACFTSNFEEKRIRHAGTKPKLS